MPQQQNPERGTGYAQPGEPGRPTGRRTPPDAPQLPSQRRETPPRPPLNAPQSAPRTSTPPRGQSAAPRPTPPGGMPSAGRPPSAPGGPRPTRMMPGPGTPETPPGPPGRPGPGNRPGPQAPTATVAAPPSKDADGSKKESDLSVNKVVAGAGAAIVTAILGSFLGAIGTVLGAALGSIITTVATTFFQRSMEHTKAQVVDKTQRIRERTTTRSTRAPGAAAWQAAAAQGGVGRAGADSQETVRIDAAAVGAAGAASPSGRKFRMSRRSIVFSLVAGLLAFGVAMFLVTGIELIKGSPITGGGTGTSIGNVANSTDTRQQQSGDQNTNGSSTSESTTPTGSSSSTSDPSRSSGNDDESTSSPSTSNPLGGLNKLLPSQGGESGKLQSGQNGTNNTGGGANPTN